MRNLYTDGIKDVIGNEPVLDQFDIAYGASFYGTMQDDYVTGTLLSAKYEGDGTLQSLQVIDKRGRVFSKLYADSQPTPNLSTAELASNPYAAFREIPWVTKTSNMFRISQYIDGTERIYDTCLPSLAKSFEADNSEPWIAEDQTSSNSEYFLSPKKNFPSNRHCFMLFNDVKGEKTSEDTRAINNSWTWGYPYEERYNPDQRYLKVQTQIRDVENVSLAARFRPDIAYTETSVSPKTLSYLTPIFAGNYNSGSRAVATAPEGRDTLRGTYFLPTGSKNDTKYDEAIGYSHTITADIDYLSVNFSSFEYVTSSAVPSDAIKALYGFGDVNSVGYPVYKEVSSKGHLIYALNLGNLKNTLVASNDAAVQTECSHIAQYTSLATTRYPDYFFINWSASPNLRFSFLGDTSKYSGWGVIQASSKTPGTIKTVPYYYVSASFPAYLLNGVSEIVAGVAWPWRRSQWYPTGYDLFSPTSPSTNVNSNSNFNTFASNTSIANGGSQQPGMISIMSFDVTSSLAWQLTYERVVAAEETSYLQTYISREHSAFKDYDYNFGYDTPEDPYSYVPETDSEREHNIIETVYGDGGSTSEIHKSSLFKSSIYAPGEYRINFAYVKPITSSETGIDRAFVSGVDIRVWDPLMINISGSYTVDLNKRVGWNKEPEYRRKFIDPRNGITSTGTWSDSEKNLDIQKYKAKAFGLAPVIRGWRHGLYSGLPTNTKAVFRRDRYGQLRDMLEQRIFTKSVKDLTPRLEGGITKKNQQALDDRIFDTGFIGSPVTVKFVKRKYSIGVDEYDKNVGKIYNEEVPAILTTSQNLTAESVSSTPYLDGNARMRAESDYETLATYTIGATVNNMGNISFK